MVSVRRVHTAELTHAELAAARRLMALAFNSFSDDDWTHALGGTHVLVAEEEEGGELRAHGSLVQRRMLVDGVSRRCGYLEAVATHPDHQRRGHATRVMDALEALAPAYDLLALSSSEKGIALYESRGWQRWRGTTYVVTPAGLERTEDDDDGVYVLGAEDVTGEIACDWREGEVW
jgi:aminoglycoside 2'-N-acetyltransferase I